MRRPPSILLAVLLFAAVFFTVELWDFTLPHPGAPRYQAVFLSNGQTYFGHYVDRIGPYVKIENAYYIQQSAAPDDGSPPESKLIKRGNELHQPLPVVLVPKTAILFVEDLRADSPVSTFMDKESGR